MLGAAQFSTPIAYNDICNNESVDEAGDDTGGILISEAPKFITLSAELKLNLDHVIYGLVGMFYFYIA